MLKEKTINIYINGKMIKYYKDKGYNISGNVYCDVLISDLPKNSHSNIKCICNNCGNEFEIRYCNYIINVEKNGTYLCNSCKTGRGINTTLKLDKKSTKKTFIYKGNNEYPLYDNSEQNEYKIKNTMMNKNTEECCLSNGQEIELLEFVKNNYKGEIIENTKEIITPYELGIYIPDLKLAIEFNGLYCHNELNKDNNFHNLKTNMCDEKGIHIVQIYEDDWNLKQDIVKSVILNKLQCTPNKIYARKCEIREIDDNKLIRSFLNSNHLQGYVNSKIKIGLFYENNLVSLMTFGGLRVSMNSKSVNEHDYEMLRFCNKLNHNIIGGGSKIFKYFMEKYKPEQIVSYANRSYSVGNFYKSLGFNFSHKTSPSYCYIINGVRKYRFGFRKDLLVKEGYDANKTEHQIMLDRGIYRIYDSGNLKFNFNI